MAYFITVNGETITDCFNDMTNPSVPPSAIPITDQEGQEIAHSSYGHSVYLYQNGEVLIDLNAVLAVQLERNRAAKIAELKVETARRIKQVIPNRLSSSDPVIVAIEVFIFIDGNQANRDALNAVYQVGKLLYTDITLAMTQGELDAIDIYNDPRWP